MNIFNKLLTFIFLFPISFFILILFSLFKKKKALKKSNQDVTGTGLFTAPADAGYLVSAIRDFPAKSVSTDSHTDHITDSCNYSKPSQFFYESEENNAIPKEDLIYRLPKEKKKSKVSKKKSSNKPKKKNRKKPKK